MPIRPTVPLPSSIALPPKIPAIMFPGINYPARGAPQAKAVMRTTYGYELKLVKEDQKYTQRPIPCSLSATRPRKDACYIRPERALSVKQIRDGEYFARPDPEAFARLLQQAREAAVAGDPSPV